MDLDSHDDQFRVAHDLSDSTKTRSLDVLLEGHDSNVTFKDLMLTTSTHEGLMKCGFERPSPVQLESIPLGRCGLDLVVQSKAGTGKTCIFAVVALEALQFNPNHTTQTLIVAPTREIATQIYEVIERLGSCFEYLQCALCIGGVDVKQDKARLNTNAKSNTGGQCQIIVGTPGRLKQLIDMNILKTTNIELLVLDEADKLMDDQFKVQIDYIFKRLPSDKQMIVTSATYPNQLSLFLQKYMHESRFIKVGKELSLEAMEEYYVESKAGHSSKKTLELKLTVLKDLLKHFDFKKGFIFTNYQARAPVICNCLNCDTDFIDVFGPTNYLCAELSQVQRNIVFKKFKDSSQRLLISTDISARGVDIHGVELVINFDLPQDQSTYYHRIGRAGRFGQPGKAISLVSGESVDKSLFELNVKSDRISKLTLPT